MDNKELIKKFSSKKFLKSNQLREMANQTLQFVKQNRGVVVVAVILLLAIAISIPSLRYYRLKRIESFNLKLYEAQKSLKKKDSYQELVQDYKDIPAHNLARLNLVDNFLDNQQREEAYQAIDQGLTDEKDIFTTLLVLKKINLLKEDAKYQEAADFAMNATNHIIPSFMGRYKLIQADLLLLSDQKDMARKIYQELVQRNAQSEDAEMENIPMSGRDQGVEAQAENQLLLLDLGVL